MRALGPLAVLPLIKAEFPKTWQVLESGLAEGVAPGFAAGIWYQGEPDRVLIAAVGKRRIEPSPLEMAADTVFDLSSLSKIVATAALAAYLVDRRWISWETPLAAVFPDYAHKKILLRHLLSHTAGLPWWEPFWQRMRDRFAPAPLYGIPIADRQRAMRELVFSVEPEAEIETRAVYSDLSFLLLGFALEEVLRMPLDRAVAKFVWEHMGLRGLHYHRIERSPRSDLREQVAATELSPWHGAVLQGQVHDENCWAMGGYSGHSGAFGTVTDVLAFARALYGGYLSRRTLTEMWTRVPRPAGCERTLGWDTPSAARSSVGEKFSRQSVGHWGFTGTSLWIDPEAGVAVALLSNRVHPTRENTKIRQFRPLFHDAIREDFSLTERSAVGHDR